MNAATNPFRVQRTDALTYRPVGMSWSQIIERGDMLRWRCAIVGPHGTGKTTLLHRLAEHFESNGLTPRHVFINDTTPAPPHRQFIRWVDSLKSNDMLLIDGAERLSRWTRRSLRTRTRHLAGVLLTMHRPAGWPTLIETRTTPALLDDLIDRLPDVDRRILAVDARELFTRHRGNLRDVMRALYDVCATEPAM